MKKTFWIALFILISALGFFVNYWMQTQPIWIVHAKVDETSWPSTPLKNLMILNYIEEYGSFLAPDYEKVVCTEFLIKVISAYTPLSNVEKNQIRIITNDNLVQLIENESTPIKGVQTALIQNNKGRKLDIAEVMPGDFVQFWNTYRGEVYGHCGVVLDIDPDQSITLYSSHPLTGGYGKQVFLWPDKVYFVRLK